MLSRDLDAPRQVSTRVAKPASRGRHTAEPGLLCVEQAMADLSAGRPVVLVDEEDRATPGILLFAAELATSKLLAFMIRHTSGYVCIAMDESRCDRLNLPPMWPTNGTRRGTAFAVTVDARDGVSTGISAADRARTIRLLADADSTAADFTRPGHVVPLRARVGGTVRRRGRTEAVVDLTRLAGLRPAGALCEIVSRDNGLEMAGPDELREFALEHGLTLLSVGDVRSYRRRDEHRLEPLATASLPTEYGDFLITGFRSALDGREHIALVRGEIATGDDVLVALHRECLVGDVFHSHGCACEADLRRSLRAIAGEQQGVLLYVRDDGWIRNGLLHAAAGPPSRPAVPRGAGARGREPDVPDVPDVEDECVGAQILVALGVRRVRLAGDAMTLHASVLGHGLTVLDEPVPSAPDVPRSGHASRTT